MEKVEAMLKGWIFLMGSLNEVFNQTILGNGVGLCNDDIVSVREERKCVLHKLEAPSFVDLINAE